MTDLQRDLSSLTPVLLDKRYKSAKVEKMLAVLRETGVLNRPDSIAVDLGCSGGFFCEGLAPHFAKVIGIDIDVLAIDYAKKSQVELNISYMLIDSDDIPLDSESADLIICNHVYEHVPDAHKLFREIERVLKPSGLCYLGAASRLVVIEPHFKLPFLSWIPKWLAHRYMQLFGKGEYYYEELRTYWGIVDLVKGFDVDDYTLRIIKDPKKYFAQDMIRPGGLVTRIPAFLLKAIYPFLPSYIFVLRKRP